ncbi:MAG: CBS domain-containing protein [Treponema sp.]|nr:CBS domain-containing protein [Treponema sp.]
MLVKSVMTKNVISVEPQTSVTQAKALMSQHGINKLPVLDSSKRLVGIITKNDITKALPSEATTLDMFEIGYLLSKLTCEKFMTKKVISLDEDTVVEEAAKVMVDNNIGCIPIVKDDLLVGIVTESDLFTLFTDMFSAGVKGVRAVISQSDKPGELAKIVTKIANLNGNLIALVTRDTKEEGQRRSTIKATGITEEQMKSLLEEVGCAVIDVRTV